MSKPNFEELQSAIGQWAQDRNIDKFENRFQQLAKVQEELGELAGAVLKQKSETTIDSVGDTLVTIIILCKQLGIDPVECLAIAYEEIANRKGKTVDGTFIKEE